jgi:hypothetical protein
MIDNNIESICIARFGITSWKRMSDQSLKDYRQQAEFWTPAVAEVIAQTIDKVALDIEGRGIAFDAPHLLHRADGVILAADIVRAFIK